MKISINDITKRIRETSADYNKNNLLVESTIRLYDSNNKFILNNAKNALLNWRNLDANSNLAFNKALDIFGEICCNCNSVVIKENFNILSEGVIKVRDANQLINSIKYKNSRIKTKISTKINNANDEVSNAINDTINSIDSKLKSSGVATATTQSNSSADTTQECFNLLLNNAKAIRECDRIIKNYNSISKRFNIDKIINETCRDNDVYQSIFDIASRVDTYGIDFKNKYNAALETAKYVCDKHFTNYSSNILIEAVTDYFIFCTALTESDINDIKSVMKESVLFEESDFKVLSYMFDDNTSIIKEDFDYVGNYGVNFNVLTEGDLATSAKNKMKEIVKGNPDEREDPEIQKMIGDFRKDCMKCEPNATMVTRLKALVNKIYAKSPYQIVYGLPKLFAVIRAAFILSSIAISPIIAVVALIADQILRMSLSRKQTEKIITAYKNEISSVKSKLEKAKDNDSKTRLQKYLDELNKDLDKIKEYQNNLHTDEENDERMYNSDDDDSSDYDDLDLDFDWDDDDDLSFDESQLMNAASIIYISELVSSVNEGLVDDNVDGIVFNNIFKLDNDALDALTDFSVTVPVILEKTKLREALEMSRDSIRKNTNKTVDDYIRIDCINNNIYKIKESSNLYNISNSPKGIICYLMCMNELANLSSDNYILEMNFTNTLKLAVNNLKRAAMKLSDKEKKISNDIDVSVNNMAKGLETALMNDNREAIIKGRILPSASKTIKIALATGAVWAINPAVAIIGALGAFACSSKLKSNERQLVLDDIEIELKMCERYLRLAEDKGDMKAVRQIEITKRNLERQQQRIKYKMHVVYKQKVPEIKNEE